MEPEEISNQPERLSRRVELPSGKALLLRPLKADDAWILGAYFLSLSDETKDFYSPHPFDQGTADRLCAEVNNDQTLRILSIVKEVVIAYFILTLTIREGDKKRFSNYGIPLNANTDCLVAPSVADNHQSTGIGSLVMAHALDVLRLLGKKRAVLQGGVQQRNERAVHFYRKFGFKTVGTFTTRVENYDMIAEL